MKKLETIYTPAAEPGFLGDGHFAKRIVEGEFKDTDPFILLMDDMLDKKDSEPAGGPHPHAGFETVTLLLEGEMGDGEHSMKAGDFQMMTAGSGIVHTETINTEIKMRLLQLWLNLPKNQRWTTPRVQDISNEHVPSFTNEDGSVKVYSGSFAGLESPVRNHVPLIVAEIKIKAGKTLSHFLPDHFASFLYVLKGSLYVSNTEGKLEEDQVGWLKKGEEKEALLQLTAGQQDVHLVLYAAEPTNDKIVPYGPFIGDNDEDIRRLYKDYREGKIKHISTVSEDQKFSY